MANKLNIVIPNQATYLEKYSAEEFAFFIKEINGTDTITVTESEYTIKSGVPFIALGATELFSKDSDSQNLLDAVGEDGYKIVIKNDCALVCGGAGQGTLFGTYRLLKHLFNLEIFAETVYTFDSKPLELSPAIIVEKPDIPMRTLGIYPVHLERRYPGMGNKKYCYRMKLRQMDEGWGINNHTYFRVLPPAKYKEEHPDWYDETGKNLCLSNEQMTNEYIENMKKIIEATPEDHLYMFGMQDVTVYCKCPECQKLLDKYDGFTGVTLYFANKCVKALNAWIAEKHPERVGKIYFFTFGYSKAIKPPVEKQPDGTYKLIHEDLRPADNFGILIAPLQVCANYALNDPRNYHCLKPRWHGKDVMPVTDIFEGWLSFIKHLAVWSYDANFYDFLAPAPMWQAFDENFRWFKELGAIHVFMEAGCGQKSNFAAMKIYVASKLMWNTELNKNDLIEKFMDVYFNKAKAEVKEYFDYIHEHAEWLDKMVNRQQIHVHFDEEPNKRAFDERFWPIGMLNKCIDMFDRALAKDLDEQTRNRVLNESLPVKFTKLYLYRDRLPKEELIALMDEVLMIDKMMGKSTAWNGKAVGYHATEEKPEFVDAFIAKWKEEMELNQNYD